MRTDAYTRLREYAKAFGDIDLALRVKPGDPLAFHNRGLVFQAKQDHFKAILQFTKSIDSGNSDSRVYYHRALSYLKRRQLAQACADLRRSVNAGSKEAFALDRRMKCSL